MLLRPVASCTLVVGFSACMAAVGPPDAANEVCVACGSDAGVARDGGAANAGADGGRPAFCATRSGDPLDDVTGTDAGPYFVHHPSLPAQRTVIFLPAGDGTRDIARVVWDNWLSTPSRADDTRVFVPYSTSGAFPNEAADRVDRLVAELELCYPEGADKLHLGGTSLGGLAAFSIMLTRPARFATLLGAPGAFQAGSPMTWAAALQGKAAFLGYGQNDTPPWSTAIPGQHQALAGRGVDSRLVEFSGQGHVLDAAFDETIFYDFWAAH